MSLFLPLPPMPEDPYDIVIRGRAVLKERQENKAVWVEKERNGKPFQAPTDATVADYQRDVNRLLAKGGNPWIAAKDTTKMKTWLKRQSALLYVAERETEQLLKLQDKLQRGNLMSGSTEQKKWHDVLQSLHFYSSVLNAKPAPDSKPLEMVKKRESKRRLGQLPQNWREQLVAHMPVWRLQAMVSAVTGCRPSEIGLGIKLSVVKGHLIAQIKGKKTGPYSGQAWRAMAWPLMDASQLVLDLADLVKKAGGEMMVDYSGHSNPNPTKAFSGAMRQAAARTFPGHTVNLTPYSMRHAMASDLKASDLSPQEVSKALGHQAMATQSTYGSHQQGCGSLAPTKVDAATKNVRGEPSVPPLKAEKIMAPEKTAVPK